MSTARIDALIEAMTVEERIGQLIMTAAGPTITGPVVAADVTDDIRAGRIGSLLNLWGAEQVHAMQRLATEESRLRIPLLFGLDVLHGLRTIFPIPLAEACLFDSVLWEQTARAAAEEATREGISITFAPMLDVTRDPRWGRIAEGSGEDPWLASRFAEAKTRGFQGADLACANSLAATAKHFLANGAPIAGRDYASADVSERSLHEIYMPPFTAAVKAGVAAMMPASNDLAGVAMTVNEPLLRGWLRERLGFEGVLISDYNAIAELLNHGVARDLAEAAALALKAGIDIDMMSDAYRLGLPVALERGLVAIKDVDASVRRVLKLKERLGLFDDPFRRGAPGRAADTPDHSNRRHLAREVARRTIVLLTLKNDILPLSPGIKRIALVGPLATAAGEMIGPWAGAAYQDDAVSILQGLTAALPDCEIVNAAGVDISGTDASGIPAAVELCQTCELVVLCVGESASMSGEAHSRADLGLPGCQRNLAEAVLDLGKPVVAILISGRPLTLPWLFKQADAVLAAWFPGTEAGHAIADVVCGRFNPTGKLPVTWPRHVGQVPIFYNERPTGRPAALGGPFTSTYIDMPETPEFSFGHGLSYSHFTIENLVCASSVGRDRTIDISATVFNGSVRDGEATVFLFIRDLVASSARPLLELKGINKIALLAGERGQVCWSLPVAALAYLGPDLQPVLESGEFRIYVGQSADKDDLLSATFTIEEAYSHPPDAVARDGLLKEGRAD